MKKVVINFSKLNDDDFDRLVFAERHEILGGGKHRFAVGASEREAMNGGCVGLEVAQQQANDAGARIRRESDVEARGVVGRLDDGGGDDHRVAQPRLFRGVEHLGRADLFSDFPALNQWRARLKARPAYAQAIPPEGTRLFSPVISPLSRVADEGGAQASGSRG